MSKQNTGFQALFDRAKSSEQFWIEKAVLQFTEDLSAFLERKSISRAELARKADCAPSFITKVLRGNTNLNIKTMVKLARVVGAQVCVHLAPEDAKVSWNDESTSTVTIVNLDVPAETFKLNQVSHPAHVAFTQVSTEKTTVVHN
jgi:plasmid maintenance system antidote protein VapI